MCVLCAHSHTTTHLAKYVMPPRLRMWSDCDDGFILNIQLYLFLYVLLFCMTSFLVRLELVFCMKSSVGYAFI